MEEEAEEEKEEDAEEEEEEEDEEEEEEKKEEVEEEANGEGKARSETGCEKKSRLLSASVFCQVGRNPDGHFRPSTNGRVNLSKHLF